MSCLGLDVEQGRSLRKAPILPFRLQSCHPGEQAVLFHRFPGCPLTLSWAVGMVKELVPSPLSMTRTVLPFLWVTVTLSAVYPASG